MSQRVVYSVSEMLELQDSPERWIVPNMIPSQGRTLVHGSGGSFKSALLFDLCVAVSSKSGLLLEQFACNKHGPVLLNSTEGSIFDNRDRLLAHIRKRDLHPSDLQLHYCQQPFMLDETGGVSELKQTIEHIKPVLVVMDPLDSFFSGDENSARETKPLRRVCDELIDTYGCSIAFIHHNKKDSDQYRGSTAWRGWIDVMLRVDRKDIDVGVGEDVPITTVTAEKVRNGREGTLFSMAPIVGPKYKRISFAYFDGADQESIAVEYCKLTVHALLEDAPQPMLTTDIYDLLPHMPQKRISASLMSLEDAGVASKDGVLYRATSADGRMRSVPAWQLKKKVSHVDAVRDMISIHSQEMEEFEEEYQIDPTF